MKLIEFKPPPGLVPEGAEENTTFEEVATFRVKKNGNICLVAIGDNQLPGYEAKNYAKENGDMAAKRYNEALS